MAQPQPTLTPTTVQLSGKIISMPESYLPKEKKRLSSTAILGIVSGFVVLLVGFVLVLFFTRQAPTEPVISPEPLPETPVETPQPTAPTPTPIPTPVPEPEPTTPLVTLPEVITSLGTDADTDQDGLSDREEQLFLTSVAVPDTDQDNFLDGTELRNLYDPATPGALLEVSPQVKVVRNSTLGYQLLIPVAWTSAATSTDGRVFEIRPDTGSEVFAITVYDNPERLAVTPWLQAQQPSLSLTQFVNFQNEAGWTGVQAQNHSVIIAAFDDGGPGSRAYIFVLHYDAGLESLIRYQAVWDMMANSLAVASPAGTTAVQP